MEAELAAAADAAERDASRALVDAEADELRRVAQTLRAFGVGEAATEHGCAAALAARLRHAGAKACAKDKADVLRPPHTGTPPPAALEARHVEGRGGALFATRGFRPGEALLVERPVLVLDTDGLGTYQWDADPADMVPSWRAVCAAAAALPDATRDRVLRMFALDPARLRPEVRDALRDFARAEGDALGVGAPAAERLPLVWSANAADVGEGRVALPVVGSMACHACVPNAVRVPDAPARGDVTFYALRPIAEGEEVCIDYLGGKLWDREQRKERLRVTKQFECACARCARPDREGALVCPRCLPMASRQHGFLLPLELPEDVGFVVRDVGGAKRPWRCTVCPDPLEDAEVNSPLPAQAPARTVLGLAEYACGLAREVELADDVASLPADKLAHMLQAALHAVGPNHYATTTFAAALLQTRGDPAAVQVAWARVSAWLAQWANLDAVPFAGADALLAVSKALRKRDPDTAADVAASVLAVAPPESGAYLAAAEALARARGATGRGALRG